MPSKPAQETHPLKMRGSALIHHDDDPPEVAAAIDAQNANAGIAPGEDAPERGADANEYRKLRQIRRVETTRDLTLRVGEQDVQMPAGSVVWLTAQQGDVLYGEFKMCEGIHSIPRDAVPLEMPSVTHALAARLIAAETYGDLERAKQRFNAEPDVRAYERVVTAFCQMWLDLGVTRHDEWTEPERMLLYNTVASFVNWMQLSIRRARKAHVPI